MTFMPNFSTEHEKTLVLLSKYSTHCEYLLQAIDFIQFNGWANLAEGKELPKGYGL